MYVPKLFAMADRAEQIAFIRANGFATLVTVGDDGVPEAGHIPLHLEPEGPDGQPWLYGHLARSNPQWQMFDGTRPALAIFHGPHAYISPLWYRSTPNVPTWNYEAVHAIGRPHVIEDDAQAVTLLQRLSADYEPEWRPMALEADYLARQVRGIVTFALPVQRLEGKRKMGQNRTAEDAAGAIAGLRSTGRPMDADVADRMAALHPALSAEKGPLGRG